METKVTSKQFWLGKSDWLKGVIIFIGTPVLYMLQEEIPGWHGNPLVKAAISATVTYLLKNFFDTQKIVISDPDAVEAVKNGEKVRITS